MPSSVRGAVLAAVLISLSGSALGADEHVDADARGFNEMVFGAKGRPLRWTHTPELVVLMSVMQYRPGEPSVYTATSERLTDAEANELVNDLTAALGLMTAGRFTVFAGVHREVVDSGGEARVLRPGQIVVGRFRGVKAAANTIGWGGRAARANGTIASGAVILDADYDRASEKRRLLRTHELGHALGYNHVQARSSIMNASIGSDVTEFDHKVALSAFGVPSSAESELSASAGE